MRVLVDTSVWSLALRKGGPADHPAVRRLEDLLDDGPEPVLCGLVLQEVLQGLPAASAEQVLRRLEPFTLLEPTRATYGEAADLRRRCRAVGVAIGTVDCLIAALAIGHRAALLTTDADFERLARHAPLVLAPT